MRKINDFDKIRENGSYKRIPDGAYIVGIKKATDNPDKEYLRLELDICKGEYKNWYQKLYDADKRDEKYWPCDGVLVRSYSDKALPFFKGFITSVEKSNPNFKWNWDEQKLVNKVFAVVIATEEYSKNNGGVGKRPYIASVHSVDAIEKGDYEIPELKKLDPTKVQATTATKSAPPVEDPFAGSDPEPSTADFDNNPFGDDSSNPWD